MTTNLHPVPAPDYDAQLAARTAEIAARIKAEAGNELRHALASQELVTCDRCGQWPGMACRTSGGWELIGVHACRRDAIAKMGDDERITTYAQKKAEQQLAHEDQERRWANPAYRAWMEAQRAEVAAVFDAVRERQWAAERARREVCRDPYLHADDCRCREPGWVAPQPTRRPVGVAEVADLDAERARRGR